MTTRDTILDLEARNGESIIGLEHASSSYCSCGLLANGHLLVEGLPGMAKTRTRERERARLFVFDS